MWGAGLFKLPTFLSNLVSEKVSHFMRATGKEGRHHLTL